MQVGVVVAKGVPLVIRSSGRRRRPDPREGLLPLVGAVTAWDTGVVGGGAMRRVAAVVLVSVLVATACNGGETYDADLMVVTSSAPTSAKATTSVTPTTTASLTTVIPLI